jgi:hypothetical protein
LAVAGPKQLELVPPNHDRFAGLDRRDGCCPVRVAVDQGELTEHLSRTENGKDRLVALRRQYADCDSAGGQRMQRVGWITVVKERFPLGEAAAAARLKQLVSILR